MPDRKIISESDSRTQKISSGIIHDLAKVVAILFCFQNGDPLGGRHSWRPAKIETA